MCRNCSTKPESQQLKVPSSVRWVYPSLYLYLSFFLSHTVFAVSPAKPSSMSVSLRAGSAGWGAEYKARVQPHLDLRLVWQTLSPGRFQVMTGVMDDKIYEAQGKFRSSGLISDWYPWTTPIRFSFGIFRNTSLFRLSEKTTSSQPKNIYNAYFGKLGYFFGAGWAPRQTNKRFSLTLDAGLLAQQPPRIIWQADSATRTTPETVQIWSEKVLLKQAFEEYKILPFLMIGLSYRIY